MTMAMASTKGENVTAVPRVKLASMLCMKGGSGDGSYLNNSQAQVPLFLLGSQPCINAFLLNTIATEEEQTTQCLYNFICLSHPI